MPKKEIAPSTDDVQSEQTEVQNKEDALVGDLANSEFIKSLDQPAESSTETEEEVEEVEEEVEEEVDEVEQEEEEVDEDLIPRSKVDKRFAQLTAEKKALEARLNALEAEATASKDPQDVKLEKMNETELEALTDEIEQAKFEKLTEADKAGYNELVKLGKKVGKLLRTAPQRFQTQQTKAFEQASQQVLADPGINGIETKEVQAKIKDIASEIYGKSKSMQSKVEGQAEALLLAAEHFKQISKLSAGRSEVNEQKRKINKLKKATSLDAKVMKGDLNKANLTKLRDKAKRGDEYDKLEYAAKSGILGDLERFNNMR